MGELTEAGFRAIMLKIGCLQRRNKDLSTRLSQVENSRETWRQKALALSLQVQRQRRRIRTLEKRVPVKRRSERRRYTAEEWQQHERIKERIQKIPNRDILSQ